MQNTAVDLVPTIVKLWDFCYSSKYLHYYCCILIIIIMASVGDDENAAELEFGREFASSSVQCLSNDEVYFLLSKKAPGAAGTNE